MGYRNTNSKILRFASSWGTQTQNILLFTFIFLCHNDMWLSKIPGNLQYWGMAIYTKNKYEGPIFPSVAQVKLKSSLLYGARTKLGYFEFASFND